MIIHWCLLAYKPNKIDAEARISLEDMLLVADELLIIIALDRTLYNAVNSTIAGGQYM